MSISDPSPPIGASPLDRARRKAYWRLLPILFACYVIAYVDRNTVGLAKLKMIDDLAGFNDRVIGFGVSCFFVGYLLLEIPGTLLVERWSARKWISRIMITWGMVSALTALIKTPYQFYGMRFALGLAEAGFFPGVIVYLTHWFPVRDRARALSWFLVATPMAQMMSPRLSYYMLRIGTDEKINDMIVRHPMVLGLNGWQWVYIGWGIPAVILGVIVLAFLTDRPGQARWLSPEEREALEAELAHEKASLKARGGHMSLKAALSNPKVLLLTLAYFCSVTGNYGVETWMPSILKGLYNLDDSKLTWLLMIPPIGSLIGQRFIGWSSDRTKERRLHTAVPIALGSLGLGLLLFPNVPLWVTVVLFTLISLGLKAYLPAFWTLPSLFLTEAAAAGSIGLINSVGNLGGAAGSAVLGAISESTGSFRLGLLYLCASTATSATIIVLLGLGRRAGEKKAADPLGEEIAGGNAAAVK